MATAGRGEARVSIVFTTCPLTAEAWGNEHELLKIPHVSDRMNRKHTGQYVSYSILSVPFGQFKLKIYHIPLPSPQRLHNCGGRL